MMKKYIAITAAAVLAAGAFTGCGRLGDKDIGRDAALEAALDDAGVKEEDTTRLRVSKDRDDGMTIYEVQFDADGTEYEYEIAASDGEILSVDTERIENSAAAQDTTQNNSNQGNDAQGDTQSSTGNETNGNNTQDNTQSGSHNGSGHSGNGSANVAISQDEAVQIALDRVSGATAADVRIELDYDDGQYKYEGDIIHEQREYEFEIDANTGTILEWSEERR